MDLVPQFNEFLKNVRLTANQISDLKTGHSTLRQRLRNDPNLSKIRVADFLQGSYVRHTAVRPKDEQRADADIIVVTNLDERKYTPQEALDLFRPFLEKYYKGKYRFQGRSIGIEMSYVDLDIVVTSAPSEITRARLAKSSEAGFMSLEEAIEQWRTEASSGKSAQPAWKAEPLRIPNRDAAQWEDTHPLAQIEWTRSKNKVTNRHYVNVVKAIKWWRRLNSDPKHPKGYPVEHLVGVSCLDGIESVAEGVTVVLEDLAKRYLPDIILGRVPYVKDHGVDHNVVGRLSFDDFQAFISLVEQAATTARKAYNSASTEESGQLWWDLFGDRFPKPPTPKRGDEGGGPGGGYTPRTGPTTLGTGRFA